MSTACRRQHYALVDSWKSNRRRKAPPEVNGTCDYRLLNATQLYFKDEIRPLVKADHSASVQTFTSSVSRSFSGSVRHSLCCGETFVKMFCALVSLYGNRFRVLWGSSSVSRAFSVQFTTTGIRFSVKCFPPALYRNVAAASC